MGKPPFEVTKIGLHDSQNKCTYGSLTNILTMYFKGYLGVGYSRPLFSNYPLNNALLQCMEQLMQVYFPLRVERVSLTEKNKDSEQYYSSAYTITIASDGKVIRDDNQINRMVSFIQSHLFTMAGLDLDLTMFLYGKYPSLFRDITGMSEETKSWGTDGALFGNFAYMGNGGRFMEFNVCSLKLPEDFVGGLDLSVSDQAMWISMVSKVLEISCNKTTDEEVARVVGAYKSFLCDLAFRVFNDMRISLIEDILHNEMSSFGDEFDVIKDEVVS